MDKKEIMEKQLFDIAHQIAAFLAGQLNDEEKNQLEIWRNTSADHERLFQKIITKENEEQKKQAFRSYSLQTGWENFRIKRQRTHQRRTWRIATQYAALLAIAIGLGYYLLPEQTAPTTPTAYHTFQPGGNRAQLILANGKRIDLEQFQGPIHVGAHIPTANNLNNRLSYENNGKSPTGSPNNTRHEISYNEISVPRCGEYQLKLSDGTLVFLNSMTHLRYPVHFSGDSREVILTGEAYFQVARDSTRPFIVHTATHQVTVLGTQFNISAFQDDTEVRTTLVNGKVCINGKQLDKPILLKPNEQFVYNKQQQQYEVKTVDVSYYTAWKDGQFRFRDASLEEIMHTIERWYDVEVIYADPETKYYTFGLNFSRNETIDPILRIFQENGKIKITPKGKTLIITKGR